MLTKSDIIKLEERFATKSDILSFKDTILHKIQGLREDVLIVTGYKDQIEDHETRIEIVEKKAPYYPITDSV